MTTTMNAAEPDGNTKKIHQAQAALAAIFRETLRRGFHGVARLELAVQDGTIQHLRRAVERVER